MRRTLFRCGLAAALAFAALLASPAYFAIGTAWAAAPVVDEAKALYDQARFAEGADKLREALAAGTVRGRDEIAAKELLGRCLVKAGDRLEAKEAFKSLLRQDGGHRLDSQNVPPDEIEVFELARREITSEQIQTGNRVPASLAFSWGMGSGDNKNMAELPNAGGGEDKFENKPSFGGSVRFPITRRLSLDIEMQRFLATATDTFPETNGGRYEINAYPISASVYHATISNPRWRLNTFLGLGAMTAATSTIRFFLGSERVALSDQKTGFYGHGGFEGEFLLTPRFAVTGRVLGRMAKVSGLYKDSDLTLYGPNSPLANREIDFSGFGAHVGVRAYIGY